MDMRLQGRWALVFGGSSGIGFAVARELAREGAAVALASRAEAKLVAAADALKKEFPGGKFYCGTVDLLQEESIRAFWRQLPQSPDVVVNNVGGPVTGLASQISLDGWDGGYHSLLRSVLVVTELALPAMQKNRWGRILNVTSTSAREMIPNLPVSGVFRAALSAWVKSVSRDVGSDNILVNNLLPGPTNTGRLAELEKKSPAFFKSMKEETAVRRIAEPEEIGRAAAFLVSGANTYLTGTDILVDGGYTKAL